MRRTRHPGAVVRCVALVACVALVGGCGFAEKRKQADRIRSAPDKLAAIGTAKTTMTIKIEIASTSAEAAGLPGGGIPPVTIAGELDYRAHRASAVLSLPGAEPIPVQLVDGTELYALRQLPTPGAPRLQRPWRKIDLAGLYDDRERYSRAAVGANFVWQATLVDLVRGALTGSVKTEGHDDVGGVRTTRYRINIDLDKAFADGPDELREAFAATRVVAGMSRLVHPGRVWLDDDGVARRIEITLRQQRSRRDALNLTLTLELTDLGAPVSIELPDDADVSTATDIAGFVSGDSPIYERAASPAAGASTTTTSAP